MLKITVEPRIDEVDLKLEGDIAGPWVHDLEKCWRSTTSTLVGRPILLDLTGVGRVDDAGRYLLALIHKAGGRMVSRGIAMRALIDSVAQDWPSARSDGGTPTPGTSGR